MRRILLVILIGVAVFAGAQARSQSAQPAVAVASVPKPHIVWKPIPYGAKRKTEMAAYARRHYRINTWRLRQPHVIVEHYTASSSFSSAFYTFSSDTADSELHELPGTCAHFIIDTDGTIYQLVSLGTMCRHTVGLNYTAIGIEHVGTSDGQVLGNRRQLRASLALTLWLTQRFQIKLQNVIGHSESVSSPYHHELYAAWRCQTHGDWSRQDMIAYRNDLRALATRYGIVLGSQPKLRSTGC